MYSWIKRLLDIEIQDEIGIDSSEYCILTVIVPKISERDTNYGREVLLPVTS
jgi:hypothetical protein